MQRFSRIPGQLRILGLGLLVLALLLSFAVSAQAQSGGGYDLTWSTVDGGGTTFSSGGSQAYSLGGTVGQPDAGAMSGGVYTLGGGFWGGVKALFYRYVPLALKN